MAPADVRVSVDAMRRAAAVAVEAASLRSVAADVGMSPTGLRQFLNGRAPYSATLRRLTAWYVRWELARAGFTPDVARAAVRVLLEAIPDAERDASSAALLAWLAEEHRRRRAEPPPWLEALRGGGE